MEALKTMIERKSNRAIQVIIDKQKFHYAENFKDNEKTILKSDSVVIFFSQKYKEIIDNRNESRGVDREYEDYILPSWKEGKLAVIPIVIKGTTDTAITKEFKDNIAANFASMPLMSPDNRTINRAYKVEVTNLVQDIVYETKLSHRRKDYIFSNRDETYRVLFCNTDSKDKLPRDCMYKSEAYKNILSEEGTSFLVGRKGSGKTTFFEVLEKYDPAEFDKRFKLLRPISVEDIREEYLYSIYSKYKNDHIILGRPRIIDLFWEIFLSFCAIYIVCVENENCRIRDERKHIFDKLANKIRKKIGVRVLDTNDAKRSLFSLSAELWDAFLDHGLLEHANTEAFLASIDANFNVDNILCDFFGRGIYVQFEKAVEQCNKKILVALDKFDAISDDFRRNIKSDYTSSDEELRENAKERSEFDSLLYRSLVITVERLKQADSGLMGHTEFCIIIPQDRVLQIKSVDRDFTKKSFVSLSWDAIELLNIIVLRLIKLFGISETTKEDIISQFEDIMKKYMSTIPLEVIIDEHGTQKRIGLFQYLLRISFWRPRDIIKYFSVLYDANEKNAQRHRTIDMSTLKALLNGVTNDIIENEFFNEYNKVVYNLEDLLERFEGKNMLLCSEEFFQIMSGFKFERAGGVLESNLADIVKLMYEYGIIGLKFDPDYVKTKNIGYPICFVHNEGMFPFNCSIKDVLGKHKSIRIVLNPIFSKRFSLHYNTSDVIGAYDWDYLHHNHLRKMAIDRF